MFTTAPWPKYDQSMTHGHLLPSTQSSHDVENGSNYVTMKLICSILRYKWLKNRLQRLHSGVIWVSWCDENNKCYILLSFVTVTICDITMTWHWTAVLLGLQFVVGYYHSKFVWHHFEHWNTYHSISN